MAKKSSASEKALVIVESPAKAKTINKYLGSGYEVKASMVHVRDLPSKGLCVDIEKDFEPTYEIMPGKKKVVTGLKAAVKNCGRLYLATDLDREGEAIAWHLAELLGVPEENTYRVIFNAITKAAIEKAFAEPGKLDMDKVMAQQARRILDRIVGYKISPLLWKKVGKGLSAGRVQSVAVKLVVEREREIRAFVPKEYWLIPAVFSSDLNSDYSKQWSEFLGAKGSDNQPTVDEQNQWLGEHKAFKAEIYKVGDKKFEAASKTEAEQIFEALKKGAFRVAELEAKESVSKPSAPFITSTLQQAAVNRLGFSAKRTMMVAQQLYEGIDLGSMGSLGLITYMRTDSTHLSQEAIEDARKYIGSQMGNQYLPDKPNYYASQQGAQQAHEAIRVTDPDLEPDQIKPYLSQEQYQLYDLIWRRFLACQMSQAKWNVTNVDIEANTPIGQCRYRATGKVLIFDGFTRLWPTGSSQQQLPVLEKSQQLSVVDLKAEQHFTKPPARYNEASLVKALEKEGIGRPSTYASIISTIQEREYVIQKEKKFYATDLGEVVTDKLCQYFPKIMDVAFTRYMEQQLDKIAEQKFDWVKVLKEFYGPFKDNLDKASEEMKHAKAETKPSEYNCPKCGRNMVYRFGRNGRFLSCSGYPECKFGSPCDSEGKMIVEKVSEQKCPKCGKPMIEKRGRFGKFLGCSDYPNCKTIMKIDKQGNVMPPKPAPEPTGIKCYKCDEGQLVVRQSRKGPFLGCNRFPRCRVIIGIKEMDNLRKLQQDGQWPPKNADEAEKMLGIDKTPKKPKRTKKVKVEE